MPGECAAPLQSACCTDAAAQHLQHGMLESAEMCFEERTMRTSPAADPNKRCECVLLGLGTVLFADSMEGRTRSH